MATFEVVVEVEGVQVVLVDAESEDEACRKAKHLVRVGTEAGTSLDIEAVRVRMVHP